MQPFKFISPQLSVAEQLQPADMARAKADGFAAVIINRPDGEGPGQPSHDDMRRAAEAAGLAVHYIPMVPGQLTEQAVDAFGAAVDGAGAPVLAYCRTGTRSATLWAFSQAGKQSTDDILGAVGKAGYDLSKARGPLDMRARALQQKS